MSKLDKPTELGKFSTDGEIFNTLLKEMRDVDNRVASTDEEAKAKIKEIENLSKNITFLHIYFKRLGITQYSRDENYSIWDLIGKTVKIFRNIYSLRNRKINNVKIFLISQLPVVVTLDCVWD